MPVDPSLILGARQVPIASPQEAQAAALEVQGKQLEYGEKVRSLKNQAMIRSVLARNGGDIDKSAAEITTIDPELGMKFTNLANESKVHALNYKLLDLRHQQEKHEFAVQQLGSIDSQDALDRAHLTLKQMGEDDSKLPTVYDAETTPKFVEGVKLAALPIKQQFDLARAKAEEERKILDDKRKLAAEQETERRNQINEDRQHSLAMAQIENIAEDNKRQLEAAKETARHNRAMEGIESKREGRLSAGDKLVKVEHKDPATGKTVIEWLPESERRGKVFEKGTGATVENRLASAAAVQQVGNDIITRLSDPAVAKVVGPAMGRFSSLQDFIGNPPPEFSELAGDIESYSLANMGVHGMRSAQGAEMIKKLLSQKHTPESLVSSIRGLNNFSRHFLENEGRTVPQPAAATPSTPATAGGRQRVVGPNGETGTVPAGTALPQGWRLQ